ncbi:hypothetical protein QJQ45_011498 [Haematococcus lacustris]|nr:hypothetical protein QJQ45_011498 [Haematococcus lacustris]
MPDIIAYIEQLHGFCNHILFGPYPCFDQQHQHEATNDSNSHLPHIGQQALQPDKAADGAPAHRLYRDGGLGVMRPIILRLGGGPVPGVCAGLQQGVRGMRVGGRRTFVVPPELGFSTSVNAPYATVPLGSSLQYEVELIRLSTRGPDDLTRELYRQLRERHCSLSALALQRDQQWELDLLGFMQQVDQLEEAFQQQLQGTQAQLTDTAAHKALYSSSSLTVAAMGSSNALYAQKAAEQVLKQRDKRLQEWDVHRRQKQQQQQGGRRQAPSGQQFLPFDPAVFDPYGTLQDFLDDILELAAGQPCSPGLRTHLVEFFGAAPSSNHAVESSLQHTKHGNSAKQGLDAMIGSINNKLDPGALANIDLADFEARLITLRKQKHGNAKMVLNVPTQAPLQQLRQAFQQHARGADYSNTSAKEATRFTRSRGTVTTRLGAAVSTEELGDVSIAAMPRDDSEQGEQRQAAAGGGDAGRGAEVAAVREERAFQALDGSALYDQGRMAGGGERVPEAAMGLKEIQAGGPPRGVFSMDKLHNVVFFLQRLNRLRARGLQQAEPAPPPPSLPQPLAVSPIIINGVVLPAQLPLTFPPNATSITLPVTGILNGSRPGQSGDVPVPVTGNVTLPLPLPPAGSPTRITGQLSTGPIGPEGTITLQVLGKLQANLGTNGTLPVIGDGPKIIIPITGSLQVPRNVSGGAVGPRPAAVPGVVVLPGALFTEPVLPPNATALNVTTPSVTATNLTAPNPTTTPPRPPGPTLGFFLAPVPGIAPAGPSPAPAAPPSPGLTATPSPTAPEAGAANASAGQLPAPAQPAAPIPTGAEGQLPPLAPITAPNPATEGGQLPPLAPITAPAPTADGGQLPPLAPITTPTPAAAGGQLPPPAPITTSTPADVAPPSLPSPSPSPAAEPASPAGPPLLEIPLPIDGANATEANSTAAAVPAAAPAAVVSAPSPPLPPTCL